MAQRTGRRPGNRDTSGEILAAARTIFSERGYDSASIRQIAAMAGVDAALVHHYFGTKEQLFRDVVDIPVEPAALIADIFGAGVEAVPERIVQSFLGICEGPATGPALFGLLRGAVSHQWQGLLLREYFTTQIIRRVLSRLDTVVDPAEIPLRASLVSSQLIGLTLARYIFHYEPLASVRSELVVKLVAPNIQRYILGELDLTEEDARQLVTVLTGLEDAGK
uniref:Transcriptional regulator n=1 Tax=Streptomyces sp. CNH287 TaxID=1288082 RepID=U6A200_9ACTN|nr:transcriptional regulator [Streptomyces sp. CNH287]